MSGLASAHVALSDCEEIRPGLVAQPANTLSSLGFVAVAAPIVRRAVRSRRWAWAAVGAASALVGVGSVAYHGPGGRASKVVHDVGVDAVVVSLVAAVWLDGSPRRVSRRTSALAAGALALHTLSRTGGPLCSCRSPLQGHAVFHLLAAAAILSATRDQVS